MKYNIDSKETKIAVTCLLLSIADADEVLEESELDIIGDILQEFFNLDEETVLSLLDIGKIELKKSTGLFQYGQQLNDNFSHEDKLDFISCIFEVAYADNELHYMEHHTIKKIADILNIHRDEIIAAKAEFEQYLD